MTTQQIFEICKENFPAAHEQTIIQYIDTAQKDFARETKLLKIRGSLSNISTNFAWALPADFESLVDITGYDVNDKAVEFKTYNLEYEIEFGKLYIYSNNGTAITSVPDNFSSIYIHYVKKPTTITAFTTDLSINEEWGNTILHRVLGIMYGVHPVPIGIDKNGVIVNSLNLRAAQYHSDEYTKERYNAKKQANMLDSTWKTSQHYQDVGDYLLPRRNNDSTSSTTVVTLTGLASIYSKFINYDLVAPSTATEKYTPIGYTGVSVAIVDNVITVTASTFGVDVQVFANTDYTWARDSSTQITIELSPGWTVATFEIWER